jgi:PAS domain S-box-containing protein
MRVGEGAAPATILVVEDERATRAALAYVLKRAGFAVREAESAAEAVSRLEDRPDLILLDVGLPDADGYAFCRRLKDDPATASVPVLLLSGLGARSEERVHGFDCGADGYLAKPAEKAELVAQVKALLRLRRVEESLRESERRYRELFDANPQPMWVTELGSMRFLAVNAAAIAKYGYPREEFLALTAADIRPSEDVPALLQSMKSPSVSMQSRGVWRHRMKDGSIREVEVSTRDVDYDGRAARLVLAVDVTEKRRAEQALREARAAAERGLARLRTVVGSMADGLVVADRHGELVEWNPAALHMHGFSGIDEARRHFTSLDEIFALSTPEGKPVTISDWPIARILRGEVVSDCELRVRRLDTGTERMIRYGGAPVRDPDGAIDLAVLNLHDVTERRRAEEELRCTAQLLRAVADGTTDAVFVKDLDGRYLLFNQAAGKFVGRDANAVLGKDDTTLFDAASAARIKERDRRVMASGEAETAEEVLTAAGVTRTYLATKAPYRDERGTIVGLIGISHDITYRKKAENKFRGLLECAPEAMVIVNQDGAIVLVNARTEQLFGYSRAELLGQSAEMLVPERFRNRHRLLRAAYATAPAAQTLGSEDALLGLRKDGSEFPVEISLSPLETEDGILISSSIRDVSERRRAEETLRLRERALDSVSQGIIITDPSKPDNPVLYANPAFERLTGYSQAEVVGRNCRFLQGEGTDPAAVAEVRRAVREGRACSLELLNYRKDHTAFWNALSVSPVRDADGKLTHFVGVQTDVTERRKLEEQYRQAQKMEVVGRLAGGVAHDFNNLLTVINGYGELVLATLPSNVPARDLVGEMVKSGERAAALTR